MKTFAVQSIEISVPLKDAFAYVADPAKLPEWTKAFESVSNGKAVLRTPNGAQKIMLTVHAFLEQGVVDWIMKFEDGSEGIAYSRLVPLDNDRCAYIFILTPPPVPLDQLEGTLEQQSRILSEELKRLRQILESS